MKKVLVVFFASAFALATFISVVQAQPFPELRDPRVFEFNAPAPLPKFVTGDRIEITEPVPRDLMVGGGQVVVGADVDGDVFIGGGQVEVSEKVEGNLLIAGGEVLVDADVQGDVLVGGGRVRLGEDAKVSGYLLVGAGQIEVLGTVDGSASLMGGTVNVRRSASVGGNLKIQSEDSTVSDEAEIRGEKTITKPDKKAKLPTPDKRALAKVFAGVKLGSVLFGFLSQLVVLLVGIYFFGQQAKQLAGYLIKSPLSMLGWGLVKLVVTPIAVLLLLVTVIGAPLGLLICLAYVAKLYLAKLVVAMALGQWMVKRGWIASKNPYLQAALGLVALSGLKLLPVVGRFVSLSALLLGLGAFLTYARATFLKTPEKK